MTDNIFYHINNNISRKNGFFLYSQDSTLASNSKRVAKRKFCHKMFYSFLFLGVFSSAAHGVSVIGTGFTWAENAVCGSNGTLWISENVRGELWKLRWNAAQGNWTQELHVSKGVKRFAGLAMHRNRLYAAAQLHDDSSCQIV